MHIGGQLSPSGAVRFKRYRALAMHMIMLAVFGRYASAASCFAFLLCVARDSDDRQGKRRKQQPTAVNVDTSHLRTPFVDRACIPHITASTSFVQPCEGRLWCRSSPAGLIVNDLRDRRDPRRVLPGDAAGGTIMNAASILDSR
jgi:hypothetical protein